MTGTIAEALRIAARRLEASSDTARLDAELLMAHALGVGRSEMLLRRLAQEVPGGFAALVERRMRHEPLAYIVGWQEFYGLELEVSPAVLIPRADSETLIEAARKVFASREPPRRILDLGTGSGALLLAALTVWQMVEGIGVERDPAAATIARRNAERLGLARRTAITTADWREPLWHDKLGRFDLVLANPPYVETHAALPPSVGEFEPAGALYAGEDGLEDYRLLIPQLAALLQPDGRAILEIGASQAGAVSELARAAGADIPEIAADLAGRPRAVALGF